MSSKLIQTIQKTPKIWKLQEKDYKYVKKGDANWAKIADLLKSDDLFSSKKNLITSG